MAFCQQRSFSLSETKLSCNAESSVTQMFFVFAVGHNHAATRSSKLKKKEKKPFRSFQTFAQKKNDACNQYTLNFKLCVERHPRVGPNGADNSRETMGEQGQGGKTKPAPVPILPSLWSRPCEECRSFSICLSVPATHASVWTGRSDLRRPAVAL